MLNIVLFGPPGAGKGTQSEKLIEKFSLVHLSTGDILRGEITQGTPLGMEAKKLMDQGILVPDEVVIGMIKNRIEANASAAGFIFDGFPRTIAQAEALDTFLNGCQTPITCMLSLKVDDEELSRRLLERGKASGRPDDQDESIIRRRIQEYNHKTAPVAGFYQSQGKLVDIQGVGEIETIFEALSDAIEARA